MHTAIRLTLPYVLVLAMPAGAAVLTVTKTADTLDGACNSDCSLREAVTAANSAPGADTIQLGPGVYKLTRLNPFEDAAATGDLDVLGELTILGAGADRTVLDGNAIDRVLDVQPDGALELHGATVRNGWARGSSPGDDQGGGIQSSGRLVLVDCLVSGNRADDGGGLIGFDLKIRNTTFSGNIAVTYGGGLISHGRLDMENVTLAGNLSRYGGGAFLSDSEDGLRIRQTTVVGNEATGAGGGIYMSGIDCPAGDPEECPTGPFLFLERSIVAGNKAPQSADCSSLWHTGLFNVFGTDPGCAAVIGDVSVSNPKLAPLGSYGGPTPTRPPLPGSQVVDVAPGYLCPGTDQQGNLRPADGNGDGVAACDAGAVEIGTECAAGGETLCLGTGDRFRVTVRWTTRDGSGAARALPLTRDTGSFWFFNASNLEIMIKVLDGCAVNDRFWVFLTGLTNVRVEVTVLDTVTGRTWTDAHPAGAPLPTRLDTDAFDVCEEGS